MLLTLSARGNVLLPPWDVHTHSTADRPDYHVSSGLCWSGCIDSDDLVICLWRCCLLASLYDFDLDSYPASGLLVYCIPPTLDSVMMYVNRAFVSEQKISSSF